VSGQLKIAPEHSQGHILDLMGKPGNRQLEKFIRLFKRVRAENSKKLYLTYYLMAAHPGCTPADMHDLRRYAVRFLHLLPEQVQIFTPTPSTLATLMYHTQVDPRSGGKLFVEKDNTRKQAQKMIVRNRHHRTAKSS
jgi:radical SAM superfamily enzyme YgiQ (UPF0313 family)